MQVWVHLCIFVNAVEIYKFKAKNSEINTAPLCLRMFQKIVVSWYEKDWVIWICLGLFSWLW